MGDGHHHRIGHRQLLPGHKLQSILVARCLRIGYRVVYKHLDPEAL